MLLLAGWCASESPGSFPAPPTVRFSSSRYGPRSRGFHKSPMLSFDTSSLTLILRTTKTPQGQGLSSTRWPSLQKPVAVRGPPGTTLLSNLAADSKVPTSSSPTPAPVLRIHQNDSLNSGKPYPYNYCFIMKTATREQPHGRALWGKGRGEGRGAFKPSPSVPRPAVNMVTHMEAPQTLSFKSCYPACISRRD